MAFNRTSTMEGKLTKFQSVVAKKIINSGRVIGYDVYINFVNRKPIMFHTTDDLFNEMSF